MKVHFSASLRHLSDHIGTYNLIAQTIRDGDNEIIKDWLSEIKDNTDTMPTYSDEEWEDISTMTLRAIREADVVILEASVSSFSLGYQAALALSYRKPLLILFDSRYEQYIIDPANALKRAQVYHDDVELQRAIFTFLKDNDTSLADLRFNMVLDKEIYSYLEWESSTTGKSKAEIIRSLIKNQIQKDR